MTAAPDSNSTTRGATATSTAGVPRKSLANSTFRTRWSSYTFDDPKVAFKHNNGSASSIRSSPRVMWRRYCAPTTTTTSITANRPGWQRGRVTSWSARPQAFSLFITTPPHHI